MGHAYSLLDVGIIPGMCVRASDIYTAISIIICN